MTIEYRWAEGQYERLPAMADDFIRRRVTLLAATSTPAALAAKAATSTIPVVFTTSSNPVQIGLVASLSRPGGNLTGATQLSLEVGPKRVELAHELVPAATRIALLINPASPVAETVTRDSQAAAATLGLRLEVLHASTDHDLDAAYSMVEQSHAGALVIGTDPLFSSHADKLAALAAQHAIPTIYEYHEFVAAGGLASYGGSVTDSYHLAGVYAGRILKGEKPADMPVQESTKVELIFNLKAAKALGLSIPVTLLGRADEVIE